MVLFVLHAVSTALIIWSTLFYLPSSALTDHVGFILSIVLLGLLSLLSFLAYRQELHFRSIFFHFWLFFVAFALAGPVCFHAAHWGGKVWGLTSYVLVESTCRALFLWVSAKTVFAYIFRDERRWAINVLSSAVVLPLSLWFFWPYWWSPELLLLPASGSSSSADPYLPLTQACLQTDVAALFLLVAFFWHKLKTDRPLGAYADTMMFFFGFFILIDTVNFLCKISSLEMTNITMLASGMILAAMSITLILRLKYKSQTIAQYYESQLLSHDSRLDRRVGWFDRLILRNFFDPEKVSESIYLGAGQSKMKVKRSSFRVDRTLSRK